MLDPVTRLNATLEGRYLADDIKHARKVALKLRPAEPMTCPNCGSGFQVETRLLGGVVPREWVTCSCASGWGRPWQALMCIAALFIAAAPLSAQTSVGLGEYHDEFVTQVVIDARVATTAGWLTPNIIVSWDLHGDGKPVLLPQVGRTLISNFPVILGADVGVSAGPWDNYSHWEPHVSATAVAFLYGPLKVVTIYSVQPWNDYARAAVIKLDWTF